MEEDCVVDPMAVVKTGAMILGEQALFQSSQ